MRPPPREGELTRLLGIAAGSVVVLVLLVVNGGYVYKTTCPNSGGSETTSWVYGIDDVLPYTRSTSPPCYSHTATRLLLSSIGIAPLKAASASTSGSSDAKSGVPGSLKELSVLKSQMDILDRRANAVKPATPITAASIQQYALRLEPVVSAYHQFALTVREHRAQVGPISDPTIRDGWAYLVTRSMLGYKGWDQIDADLLARNYSRFATQVRSFQARTRRLDEQWTTIAVVLNERYHA